MSEHVRCRTIHIDATYLRAALHALPKSMFDYISLVSTVQLTPFQVRSPFSLGNNCMTTEF